MIKNRVFKRMGLLLLAGVLMAQGCRKDAGIRTTEPVKDISGSWKLIALSRNGEDMTSRMDLSSFRIVFDKDSTYTLEGSMAFVVSQPGSYHLDDPQYPFFLYLQPQKNAADTRKIKFSYPVVEGKRQIEMTFSLGCSENTYVYQFERDSL